MGDANGQQDLHCLRRTRWRGQGRHHQGDYRACESAHISRRRAARAERARKEPDVRATLPAVFAGRGRGRDLRPQLVQPRGSRAGDGFLLHEEVESFYKAVPLVEQAIVGSGIILLKYWLEVSEEEQTRRLESRIHDGRKVWKLSGMDLKSYSRWYDYSRARDAMFKASDTEISLPGTSRIRTTSDARGSTSSATCSQDSL